MSQETADDDEVFQRICESSTRLMAGCVTPGTMRELQRWVLETPDTYPWEGVVDRILEEHAADERVSQQALRAQRDWVVRGGRGPCTPSVRMRAKRGIAWVLARLIFAVLLIAMSIVVLLLLKFRWPELDIYHVVDWARATWPALGGG